MSYDDISRAEMEARLGRPVQEDMSDDSMLISVLTVLKSAAGYYIGRLCIAADEGFVDRWSRDSGYFPTEEVANKALSSINN